MSDVKRSTVQVALKALDCLYITVDADVADDVGRKVRAALNEQVETIATLREQCRKFATWTIEANDGDHIITSDEKAAEAQAWLAANKDEDKPCG